LILSYKYRLYPTKKQAEFLTSQLAAACDLYNCALQERRDAWKTCRKSVSFAEQCRQIKFINAEGLLGLANVDSAHQVLRRLEGSFKNFYRRGGYPRFKSAKRYDSLDFRYANGCKLLDNGKLRVAGAGHIKIRLHRDIPVTPKRATVFRSVGKWFVVFCVERSFEISKAPENAVGVDLGLTTFAALSDGSEISNPRHTRREFAKLRRIQRQVARRSRNSARRRKAVNRLQKTWGRIRDRRTDFTHKTSRKLVENYGVICLENINVRLISRGFLRKEFSDAAWSSFLQKLSYKAESAGRVLVKVDPRGTSQTCTCGAEVRKKLSDRWHNCAACGLSAPRDLVSAQVILQRGRIALSGRNVEVVDSCVS
jgi:putative transposase